MAWVERAQATPALAKVNQLGEAVMRTSPDQHRHVLAELGVSLTENTIATGKPRRGPMTV
jgi:hypothetical protein